MPSAIIAACVISASVASWKNRLSNPGTDVPTSMVVGEGLSVGPEFDRVLAAAQAGSEWAFTVLYRELNPRLLRYLSSQAPAMAEDLAAETWMGAARNLKGFQGGEDAFRGWLFQIAYRRLVQHWRDQARNHSAPVDPYTMADHPAARSPEDHVLSADSVTETARRIREILSPDQAQVILLRVFGGLSVEQVAEVLGKRGGTVRVLQHKALKRLAGQDFSLDPVTK